MKIAIIGAGNMGGAVARGLACGSTVSTSDIFVSNPSTAKLEALKNQGKRTDLTLSQVATKLDSATEIG